MSIVACNTGTGSYIEYHDVTIIASGNYGAIKRVRCDTVSITGMAMHHCYSFTLIEFDVRQSKIRSSMIAFANNLEQIPRLPSQHPTVRVNYRPTLSLAAFHPPNNNR